MQKRGYEKFYRDDNSYFAFLTSQNVSVLRDNRYDNDLTLQDLVFLFQDEKGVLYHTAACVENGWCEIKNEADYFHSLQKTN